MLLTEAVAPFWLTLTVWLLLRAAERPTLVRSGLAGSLSVATSIRPNVLLLYPFVALFLWVARRPDPHSGRRVCAQVLAFSLPRLILVSVDNSRLVGRPVGLSTNGGLNFFLTQADYRAVSSADALWAPVRNVFLYRVDYRTTRLSYDEAFFYQQGIAAFLQRRDKLAHTLSNLSEGFGLGLQGYWPANGPADTLGHQWERGALQFCSRAFLWALVLPVLLAAATAGRRGQLFQPTAASRLLSCALIFVLVVTFIVFLPDPRIHVPFDPALIAFAVAAAEEVGRMSLRYLRA